LYKQSRYFLSQILDADDEAGFFILKMNKAFLEKVFSNERMSKYFAAHPNDDKKGVTLYHCNIEISEAFYPLLSILEVAFRNSVNRELITMFGEADWYTQFSTTAGLGRLMKDITTAQNQITKRHEIVTPSKVVAELTLGFWVRLFNAEFERILWKDLRRAFPYLQKVDRKRHMVSAPLNNFRNFRNRIFHNEPICWNMDRLQTIHDELITLLGWLNKDLPAWAQQLDKFPQVIASVKAKI
jgi:hypothetical protein